MDKDKADRQALYGTIGSEIVEKILILGNYIHGVLCNYSSVHNEPLKMK